MIDPLRIDHNRFTAQAREGDVGRNLEITAHELRLLSALADADGGVLSLSQLVSTLVGDRVITERAIDSHLYNLRRKLGPLKKAIETVRVVGYRLVLRERCTAA